MPTLKISLSPIQSKKRLLIMNNSYHENPLKDAEVSQKNSVRQWT